VGERFEVSLLAAALAAQIQDLVWLPGESDAGSPTATRADLAGRASEIADGLDTNPYYRCYEASDGFLAVACLNLAQRRAFATLFELDDPTIDAPDVMPDDPALVAHKRAVTAAVVERMAREELAVWRERLARIGVPAGPVHARERVDHDQQIVANGFLAEVEQPGIGMVTMLGRLFGHEGGAGATMGPAPELGADTESVLAEIGAR
jgi:crotonobetainyl-CoA:carnitine CoA-transferase CaiB-like acyl-CoA transferase